jgi:hypothetical protein
MQVHRRLLDTDPQYAAARQEVEDFTFEYSREPSARRGMVVLIPVVVHIVWNTEVQDISEEQVHSQLQVLNSDFRGLNPDIIDVPLVWQPVTADPRIEFALATIDPDGNPTTGITRTHTEVAAFGADDQVKFAVSGGADAWPAQSYLNVWVCQLGGGLLGYAQFPGGPLATDGVVITHSGFGTLGSAAAPFDGGRTATHEVGHWLNLRHIWGDDGDGCSGVDFVADTPNQAGPNFGAPMFPTTSCDNGPDGDMFMNYMDYTDDAAMFMFTVGQAERMDACLAVARASLVTVPDLPQEPDLPHVPAEPPPAGGGGPAAEPPPELFRRWVHVREEDRNGVRVYRPVDHPIPPARGREGIEFRPDGTYIGYAIGPTDAPAGTAGQWWCDAPDHVRISQPDHVDTSYLILDVDDRILRLRPQAGA